MAITYEQLKNNLTKKKYNPKMKNFRNAGKNDAKVAIDLLDLAMDDIAFTLSGENDKEKSDAILESFFIRENNRLSYENIILCEIDGQVVGAICSYDGTKAKELDLAFISYAKTRGKSIQIDTECEKNELYIDSVAVDREFRRRGIASELIKKTFDKARNLGLPRVSLIVDINKPKTRQFYESLGFEFTNKMIVNSHEYDRLIKETK